MQTLNLVGPGPPVEKPAVRDYLSFSAVSTFAACPLRYYFRYVAGLPEEVVSASLAFGSAFHAALEHHFRELLAGLAAPSIDTLLDAFWEAWMANTADRTIQFGKGDGLSGIGELAQRMFLAFQGSDLALPAGTIIGVEEEIRGVLIPDLPDLLARVDLIVDTGDAIVITDFKTSRSAWSTDHVEESGSQLLLYHELVKHWAGGRPLRLGFGVVTKTKTPQVELHHVLVDATQVQRTKRVVERVWQAIQTGHYYPNPSPLNCPTCPYRQPCRTWQG